MADVALISVISSALVGVLGGASGFYGQRVTLHNERAKRLEARRDDLRAVLAEAAGAAMGWNRAAGALGKAVRGSAEVMDTVTTEMQLHVARLGVRVGPRSRAFAAYQHLQQTIFDLEDGLRAAPHGLTFEGLRDTSSLDESVRATAEEIARLSGAVYAAMHDFLDASSTLVGPPA